MEQLRERVKLTESGAEVYQLVKVRHRVHAMIKSISCAHNINLIGQLPIFMGNRFLIHTEGLIEHPNGKCTINQMSR